MDGEERVWGLESGKNDRNEKPSFAKKHTPAALKKRDRLYYLHSRNANSFTRERPSKELVASDRSTDIIRHRVKRALSLICRADQS